MTKPLTNTAISRELGSEDGRMIERRLRSGWEEAAARTTPKLTPTQAGKKAKSKSPWGQYRERPYFSQARRKA